MNLILRQDGAGILEAEAIKLKNTASTSTDIVRSEMTTVDPMKALVNYAQKFLF